MTPSPTTHAPTAAPVANAAAATPVALRRYAFAVAVSTGILIFAGGLVTSTGSGLSVPDWPLSYGKIMPPMVGNVRFEHGHRMIATAVGALTVILAIWLAKREPRAWVRRLGWAALAAVVLQGLLGGLTVKMMLPAPVSVAHGTLGQIFFCLVTAIAFFTSPDWFRPVTRREDAAAGPSLRTLALCTTGAVFVQLVLGATMRHREAGLAIPDFPLAFGKIIPPLGNGDVAIHFAHRAWAALVATLALVTVGRAVRHHGPVREIARPAQLLAILVVVQLALGAATIWTHKAAVPTTFHVLNGALVLVTSLVLTLRVRRSVAARSRAAAFGPMPTPRAVS
jgi:cytochrome c oxidase assembly protein subunit 15